MVTSKILTAGGYAVTLAEDGDSALSILSDLDFDLILLDINMPGTSGIDLIKLYRIMRLGMAICPIAVFSADVTEDIRNECSNLGIQLFLPKPSKPAFMLQQLANLLPPLPQAVPTEAALAPVTSIATHPKYKPQPELTVMDRQALQTLALLDSDPSFMQQLIGEFEQDAETILDDIDRSVQMRTMHDFWDHIHALRSSAANVGARQLCVACNDISAQGKVSFNTRGSEYAARLRYEFQRYQKAIGRFLTLQDRMQHVP
jgi:two-component system sensor histidine kinase RpfC